MKYEIEWSVDPNYFAQDAVFYGDGYGGSQVIATVTKGERSIEIRCDGEIRYNHPEGWTVRNCDEWEDHEIFSDDDLSALPNEANEWVNNSWFDCYNAKTGEHLDAVQHLIYDALGQAKALLDSDEYWT
jgi:hypothetical protein